MNTHIERLVSAESAGEIFTEHLPVKYSVFDEKLAEPIRTGKHQAEYMKGQVFNIQKFSIHDGPGIRTTVFLKGCPLRCIWCHNPESWNLSSELMYDPEKCLQCGKCVKICPSMAHTVTDRHLFDREKCMACGDCCKVCLPEALELCGTSRTVEEVMTEVLEDLPFYQNSGGGVTFSGGEPMFQFEFLKALLKVSRHHKLHTVLETCGFAPRVHYAEILPLADLFLFDIKIANPEKHRRLTGQDNRLILENLQFLNKSGVELHLRCPLIPGVNDSDVELADIGALAEGLKQVKMIEIVPYHPLGECKFRRLGKEPFFTGPITPESITAYYIKQITAHTNKKTVKA